MILSVESQYREVECDGRTKRHESEIARLKAEVRISKSVLESIRLLDGSDSQRCKLRLRKELSCDKKRSQRIPRQKNINTLELNMGERDG